MPFGDRKPEVISVRFDARIGLRKIGGPDLVPERADKFETDVVSGLEPGFQVVAAACVVISLPFDVDSCANRGLGRGVTAVISLVSGRFDDHDAGVAPSARNPVEGRLESGSARHGRRRSCRG